MRSYWLVLYIGRREEARKEKLRAELADVKDGGVAKKGKKKKKTSAILSFEEVDE